MRLVPALLATLALGIAGAAAAAEGCAGGACPGCPMSQAKASAASTPPAASLAVPPVAESRLAVHRPEPMATAEAAGPVIGAPAPDFALQDQEGRTVQLAALRGQVVVLEWFNLQCPFVVQHIERKTMKTLQAEYAAKGVTWLAIDSSAAHDAAAVKKHHGEAALPYPLLSDQSGAVGQAYRARTTPHMFVIDRSGRLVYDGAIDDSPKDPQRNHVREALDAVLAGQPVPVATTKPYGCSVKYARR